jgi:cytoskeletal protein CcmA (bactofilin family)/DNA-directed RNA polymerase subunit RPC12/RpoP
MPAAPKTKTVSVTCPKCGHTQPEPRGAYSTICKKCRAHFRLEETDKPAAPKKEEKKKAAIECRKIICFSCSTELDVPVAAESTMCKRCSSHVDLRDYQITATVSKNYRTYGRLVLEEKGYMMNTDSVVGDAVLKGRIIGKITAKRSLEIFSTAIIKGTFTAGRLVIPAGNHFRWLEPLRIDGAEIGGELVANIQATGTVVLKATGRLFGDVVAGNLVVESGAIFVGQARIGSAPAKAATSVETPARAGPTTSTKPRSVERKTSTRKTAAV